MAGKQPEFLKKITLGACNAQPDTEEVAAMEKSGKPLDVLDIIGIARKFKTGMTNMGEYVKFIGNFKAKNLVTEDEYMSSAVILPKFLEEQLWSVMSAEGANDVQFAFRITARFDRKAATKYTYSAIPLLKPSENDPVELLAQQVYGGGRLAAPKSEHKGA